jgi:hypothetical protein
MKKIIGLFILLFLTSCSGMVLQAAPVEQSALEALVQPQQVTQTPAAVCVACPSPVVPTPDCSLCATAACADAQTITETPLTPTLTPTVTSTPLPPATLVGPLPYKIHPGSPVYMPSLNGTCAWTGVGGMVMDASAKGVKDVVVIVQGKVKGQPFESLTLSGLSPAYGALGGYEVHLSNELINSTGSLYITLYSLAGQRLSDPVAFDTIADCGKNRVIMSFQKIP